jgi:hypothetical protein
MNKNLLRIALAATLAVPTTFLFASASLADTRDFKFNNRTGGTITRLYVASSRVRDWGRDLLRRDVIEPGDSVNVSINEGSDCLHDLRAQFRDGTVVEVSQLNLCEISEYSFYP